MILSQQCLFFYKEVVVSLFFYQEESSQIMQIAVVLVKLLLVLSSKYTGMMSLRYRYVRYWYGIVSYLRQGDTYPVILKKSFGAPCLETNCCTGM